MADSGLLVVDKPSGWTSHDVVARVRRLCGTRRVGHAGTLDPMATGVLLVGVERCTRLLGHLALTEKSYDATIRLGITTATDDAEGEVVRTVDASHVDDLDLGVALASMTGEIRQVPPAYSAVQVGGVRSYAAARRGDALTLAPRNVVVHDFDLQVRRGADLDVRVRCSSGTYIRGLARDLGAALDVGAHLSALRRTSVGPWTLDEAHPLDDALPARLVPLSEVADRSFPRVDLDGAAASDVVFGRRIPLEHDRPGPIALFNPAGDLLALAEVDHGKARYLAVLAEPGQPRGAGLT